VYFSPNQPASDLCTQLLYLRFRHPNLSFILTGDFNVQLHQQLPFNARDHEIVETLDILGVTDMLQYFPQRRHFRDGATWRGHRNGKMLQSTCDYVLSDDSRRRFQRIRITDPRTYDSDHLAITFTLRAKNQKHQQHYVKVRKSFPLHTNLAQVTAADHLLSNFPVLHVDPRQRTRPQRPLPAPTHRASWVSDYTWKLIDTRASLRRQLHQPHNTFPQQLQTIS
jgi:hypothetical protein